MIELKKEINIGSGIKISTLFDIPRQYNHLLILISVL